MAKFKILTAAAVPIVTDDIDTDQIFPARFMSKDRNDGKFGTYFLHDQRYDENGHKKNDFILNDKRLANAKIIVAAANYACGSARPGAIFSHLDYGIKAVIAESFGPVFASVAYKSGLLTIQLRKEEVKQLRDELLESIGSKITIDVAKQFIIAPDGTKLRFEIDHFVKRMIMEDLSEIDLTLGFEKQIKEFEAQHQSLLPWVFNPR